MLLVKHKRNTVIILQREAMLTLSTRWWQEPRQQFSAQWLGDESVHPHLCKTVGTNGQNYLPSAAGRVELAVKRQAYVHILCSCSQ